MVKVVLYTSFALTAFAFNSILCRLALRGDEADAAGFTAVRLVSGAIVLSLISLAAARGQKQPDGDKTPNILPTNWLAERGNWIAAMYLFAYAICFSLAYLNMSAATGALILFGSVQVTMVSISSLRGDRAHIVELLGLAIAAAGLVYLVFPGVDSPPPASSVLMAIAGAAWGLYSLRGKSSTDALGDTTANFIRTIPFAAVAVLIFLPDLHLSAKGWVLASVSGAIASGIGYSVWYAALKHHSATRAAVLQLSVPVITAVLGILLLGEVATMRLAIAAVLVLGGITATVVSKAK